LLLAGQFEKSRLLSEGAFARPGQTTSLKSRARGTPTGIARRRPKPTACFAGDPWATSSSFASGLFASRSARRRVPSSNNDSLTVWLASLWR
jgi:hypothetical protein